MVLALGLSVGCKSQPEKGGSSDAPRGQVGEPADTGNSAGTEDTEDTDEDVWEAVNRGEPGPRVSLCAAKSPALADARARFEALDALAGELDEGSLDDFNTQATALYRHACLAVGRADEPRLELSLDSASEAKLFWEDGLSSWFRAYLDLADGTDETVWLLPTPRTVVTAKTRPTDPMAPWMCPVDPESPCAQSTRAWRLRAERYFELWRRSGKIEFPDCDAAIESGPSQDAYARWRTCENEALRRYSALPPGGLGPLDTGWIVVHGRRGHYQYCDEVAVFDLVSGSHYRFAECEHRPELDGLARAGAVDPPPGGVEVETGTIPAAFLHEFAWVAASIQYVQADVVMDSALGRQLPAGVEVSRSQDWSLSGLGLSGVGSSGHTTIGWQWIREAGEVPTHGEFSWPTGLSDPAEDHAVRLLTIAELRTAKGCAAAELPAWVVDHLRGGQLAASELVDPPSEAILNAMRTQVKRGRCAR